MAEACQDFNLAMGPVEDTNHKGIGAAAMGYGHIVISSSPIDVNIAKQVNILLENLGMPMDKIIIDPTTGGLGYGLEYSYSVMERLRMAAMAQGDDKLQFPIINNLANEVWKCKEAKLGADEAPELGDPERRGILMEAVGAVSYLMAGTDIMIMRHPEAIRMVKAFIDLAVRWRQCRRCRSRDQSPGRCGHRLCRPGPEAGSDHRRRKSSPGQEGRRQTQGGKEGACQKAAPKKAEPKKAEAKKAEPEKAAPAVDEKADAEAKAKADADAKAKAEADAKAKAEADAKAKADAEAKAKADAEAKAKAEADAKAKAAADAKAERDAEEDALRQKRAAEREKLAAKRAAAHAGEEVSMTAAAEQKSDLEKMLDRLNWVHRRVKLY